MSLLSSSTIQAIQEGSITELKMQRISEINQVYSEVFTQMGVVKNIEYHKGAGIYGMALDVRDSKNKKVKYNFYHEAWIFHDKQPDSVEKNIGPLLY